MAAPGASQVAQSHEVWREAAGAPGWEVSDHGRVRSCRRGGFRLLHPVPDRRGYLRLKYEAGRTRTMFAVHRLVLASFVGPCPPGHEASHLNGDARDNRLDNLLWESPADNNRRKHEHGTAPVGDANPSARFTVEQIRAIREVGDALPQHVLARLCDTTQQSISKILRGKRWSHLDE